MRCSDCLFGLFGLGFSGKRARMDINLFYDFISLYVTLSNEAEIELQS